MNRAIIFLIIFIVFNLSAQDSSVVVGIRTHIQSKILNEEREILISVPDSYTKGEMTYPVMYLLDAEEHFRHVAGIVEFLSQQKRIPSMILVGITNTKRMRDLTPKTETDSLNKFSGSGGSDRFTDFLESELFSFIEKNYRVCSYRILVGHSLGGLFAVHTWSSRAKLFNAYIAISPSLWWNGMRVIRESEVFLNNGQTIPSLYVTIGDEREDMVRSNESLHKALQNHRSHFQWKYTVMANEDHGSIAHRSVYDGLEWLYQGWLLPANYETMNLAELQKHAQEMAKKFGYAIVTEREVLSATGNRLRVKGQFEKAIAVLQFNSTQNPEWPTGYDELGLALEVAGKLDEAAIQYQYAVDKSQVIGDSNTDLFRQHWMAIQKRLKK